MNHEDNMDIKTLQKSIEQVTVWQKNGQRAPHKPLLLLYALSQYKQGHKRLFNYGTEIQQPLLDLLNSFGPQRKTHHPNMPFWRLKGDGFWQLENTELCANPAKESKEPTSKHLIECDVLGGFTENAYKLISKKPKQIDKLAQQILNEHFPESIQDIIANQLGLSIAPVRDPKFRLMVLRTYNYQCAVCGYDLRQDFRPVGLQAAHVKWKQAKGPCSINNGLALCSIHHLAFDMGSIGLDHNKKLLISKGLNGHHMLEKLFWDFEGKSILLPKAAEDHLHEQFIDWHLKQVFKY